MIFTMDKQEKILPPAEEAEKGEVEEEEQKEDGKQLEDEEGEEDDAAAAEEEEDGDDEAEESRDGKEKEEAAMLESADETEKKTLSPVQPKNKKKPEVLNLNNEVVNMRKEVKRLRALISRKLVRRITALKKKKGEETAIERNQKRAARLLEEIHAMKILSPDMVTKTALQKNLNFEQVCKNPKSTISDRALARIATHPQFNKKIEDIKAAVQAFKEERMKGLKDKKGKGQNKDGKVNLKPLGTGERKGDEEEKKKKKKEEEDSAEEHKETADTEERDGSPKNAKQAAIAKYEKDTGKANSSAQSSDDHAEKIVETKSAGQASAKNRQVKDVSKNNPQSRAAETKPDPTPETLPSKRNDQESDLEESGDEEKEYFDDSTEERFHKQSSQSEGSDSDDDFFLGKVSKFKKKRKSTEGDEKKREAKVQSAEKVKVSDRVQSELDELESRLKSKGNMQSVFCSLSGSKPGAGRGGSTFRDRGKPRGGGMNRDFSKQSKFQKQDKATAGSSESRRPEPEGRGFGRGSGRGSGRGRGRGDGPRQNDRRSGGVSTHQSPQQALHPSWEASKKRKEQQGQILAFQGKKIKFDDDD